MHDTFAIINYKMTQVSWISMHQGLPSSKGMLGSTVLDEYYPPSSSAIAVSFSIQSPTTTVPTCDDNLINDFEQDSI
jgi:hypothetical protein